MSINRRSLITGLISFVAAPAIVRAGSLMPVKAVKQLTLDDYVRQILYPMMEHYYQEMLDDMIIYGVHVKDKLGNRIDPREIYANNSR